MLIFLDRYGLFALVFIDIPASPVFDPETFNWAPVVFVGFLSLAVLFYAVRSRHTFKGPALRSLDGDLEKD